MNAQHHNHKALTYSVRVVLAKRGGIFITTAEFGVGAKIDAMDKAEELQAQFDRDCDPVRVYVIAPADKAWRGSGAAEYAGLPCYAAGTPQYFAELEQRQQRRAQRQLPPPHRVGPPGKRRTSAAH